MAAFLGWLAPGLGQLYLGRPLKALLFFGAILPTFLVGWKLTGFTAVDPQRFRLDFAGQLFLGLPTFGALAVTADHVLSAMPPFFEVGRLYVLVAGLLNLVAICDALGDAISRDRELLAARLAHREREAAQQDTDVAPPPEPTPTPLGWEDPA